MVTLEELKKIAQEEKQKLKEIVDNTRIENKSGLNPNYACSQIVDLIFDKIIDLMNKDRTKSGFEKGFIVSGAKRLKEPIKDYVMKMNRNDAIDVVKRVKTIMELVG